MSGERLLYVTTIESSKTLKSSFPDFGIHEKVAGRDQSAKGSIEKQTKHKSRRKRKQREKKLFVDAHRYQLQPPEQTGVEMGCLYAKCSSLSFVKN